MSDQAADIQSRIADVDALVAKAAELGVKEVSVESETKPSGESE